MRNLLLFVVLLLSVFPLIQAQDVDSKLDQLPQIVGGHAVARGDYFNFLSHTIAIRNLEKDSICTGTILSANKVLVAAHCLENSNFKIQNPKIEILVGYRILGYETQRFEMSSFQVHPQYSNAYEDRFDLAIIAIEKKWPEYVVPAELVSQRELQELRDSKNESLPLMLVGFGSLRSASNNWSDQLRSVNKTVLKNRIKTNEIVLDQRDGFGTCVGDSGGPALVDISGKKKVLAVTSLLLFPHYHDDEKCTYDSLLSIVYREMLDEQFNWVTSANK